MLDVIFKFTRQELEDFFAKYCAQEFHLDVTHCEAQIHGQIEEPCVTINASGEHRPVYS